MTDCLSHAPTLLADPLAMLMMAAAGVCLSAPLAYTWGRIVEQRRHTRRLDRLIATMGPREVTR